MELTLREEKWEDGFHYVYHVDSQGRKQGEVVVYFPDEKTGERTEKVHARVNFKDDMYHGEVRGFDSNDLNFLETYFDEAKLNGLTVLQNDKGVKKELIFIAGNRVS
jgi:hypothetical protein